MKTLSKRSKSKSEASLRGVKSENTVRKERDGKEADRLQTLPLDVLTVKILSLRLANNDSRHYAIKVTFFNQLLISGIIKSIDARDVAIEKIAIAKGTMNYDPSDYDKMCLFADFPLIVHIQPLRSSHDNSPDLQLNVINPTNFLVNPENYNTKAQASDISCCNIDVLKMFIDTDEMCVKVRMQPSAPPTALQSKSWDNLPLLTMTISVERDEQNKHHHDLLKMANYAKITLIGAYNMMVPYDDESVYTVASKSPLHYTGIEDYSTITFNDGMAIPKNFDSTNFYPLWESLRVTGDAFCQSNEKFFRFLDQIQNDADVNLEQYLMAPDYNTAIWGSFHRTLILGSAEQLFYKKIRTLDWPIEVHSYGRIGGQSYMAFLPLHRLLYAGERRVCIAAPLHFMNPKVMLENTGCNMLIPPFDAGVATGQKGSKAMTDSTNSPTDTADNLRPTGNDDTCAFVVVEVKLARPLVKLSLPKLMPRSEISEMLNELEQDPRQRECIGRGQLDRDWQATIRSAAASLRKVPHHGLTEFCIFYRQLSETRTRVELSTSFWLDAAVYVNNNFVVHEYLEPDNKFEELLVMSHACLMKIAVDTLVGVDNRPEADITLRAARQARQLQDVAHATDLYFQVAAEKSKDGNVWRELSTCLKDVDRDWAEICIDKAFHFDHRHPLTLLAKACMVYDEDPDGAEPFFMAVLALYPNWATACIITSVYFIEREMFCLADMIIELLTRSREEIKIKDKGGARAWERELGDWWEPTPLLPGMSPYYDAADLLLRLRAMNLAEACLAVSLTERCETAVYFHLVALSCRLRGDVDNALCHLHTGITKYGEINFLRNLEAECYHKVQDIENSKASFEKSGTCVSAFSILLSLSSCEPARVCPVIVELLRRQPSAYAWMALADYWVQRISAGETETSGVTDEPTGLVMCAQACAVQALKIDRRAGRAWALLAESVKPSMRRSHCIQMAVACGYHWPAEPPHVHEKSSRTSISYHTAIALRKCKCLMCDHIAV